MTPPFALFEIAPERVNAFFMYVLSIIGGGVAGFFGAMAVGKLADCARNQRHKSNPPSGSSPRPTSMMTSSGSFCAKAISAS